jgi:hypothetical protein
VLRDTPFMILPLRPDSSISIPGPVPLRRRVIVIGATEGGVSTAFHLGQAAMLLEQRNISTAAAVDDSDSGPPHVQRWHLPELVEDPSRHGPEWDDVWLQLLSLMSGEVRLGARVTAINARERSLTLSTGESFVYDKLVSTLRLEDLRHLISDELPRCIRGFDWWLCWLGARDIELIDSDTQTVCGDVDGEAAGKRLARTINHAMRQKYSRSAVRRTVALFEPRVIGASTFQKS